MQLWQQPIVKSYIITSSWGCDATVPVEDAAPILLQQVKTGQRGSGEERGERCGDSPERQRESFSFISLLFLEHRLDFGLCLFLLFSHFISCGLQTSKEEEEVRKGRVPFKRIVLKQFKQQIGPALIVKRDIKSTHLEDLEIRSRQIRSKRPAGCQTENMYPSSKSDFKDVSSRKDC